MQNIYDPESNGFWNRSIVFLKRDVRSFLPYKSSKNEALDVKEIAVVNSLVESLIDPEKLQLLAFQREVMNWRDNAHANLTLKIIELNNKFIRYIDAELEEVNLFRRMVSIPADEVLQHKFIREFRMPLIASLHEEETNLAAHEENGLCNKKLKLIFDKNRLKSECACMNGVGFKPSNRLKIIRHMNELIFGEYGLVENFREQVTCMADRLIEARKIF